MKYGVNIKDCSLSVVLTVTDQKPQKKSLKRWYYSASHWHSGDVMMGNIIILMIFAVFDLSPLTLWINFWYLLVWIQRHIEGSEHKGSKTNYFQSGYFYTTRKVPTSPTRRHYPFCDWPISSAKKLLNDVVSNVVCTKELHNSASTWYYLIGMN